MRRRAGRADAARLGASGGRWEDGPWEGGGRGEDVCQRSNNRTGFTREEGGRDELTAQSGGTGTPGELQTHRSPGHVPPSPAGPKVAAGGRGRQARPAPRLLADAGVGREGQAGYRVTVNVTVPPTTPAPCKGLRTRFLTWDRRARDPEPRA